jgi:hypothetical protein
MRRSRRPSWPLNRPTSQLGIERDGARAISPGLRRVPERSRERMSSATGERLHSELVRLVQQVVQVWQIQVVGMRALRYYPAGWTV